MDEQTLKERTKRTAQMLFHTLKSGTGFELWKKFENHRARELSMFFTAVLYSREVLSQKQRELCAVAALTALHRPNEVRAHIHASLNVGATRQEVAEVIFQMVTYGGMPVVVDALEVDGEGLAERGEAFPGEEPARGATPRWRPPPTPPRPPGASPWSTFQPASSQYWSPTSP